MSFMDEKDTVVRLGFRNQGSNSTGWAGGVNLGMENRREGGVS